jgi:hypothetical protein
LLGNERHRIEAERVCEESHTEKENRFPAYLRGTDPRLAVFTGWWGSSVRLAVLSCRAAGRWGLRCSCRSRFSKLILAYWFHLTAVTKCCPAENIAPAGLPPADLGRYARRHGTELVERSLLWRSNRMTVIRALFILAALVLSSCGEFGGRTASPAQPNQPPPGQTPAKLPLL